MRYLYICFVMMLTFCTGCVSNYRLAIIREARDFALEQHPNLSDRDIHAIKFTTPRLASNKIFARDAGESKEDIMQTVVIWQLPDQDGKSLMVVGYGERELHNWSPNRSILKRFRIIGGEKKKRPTAPVERKIKLKEEK